MAEASRTVTDEVLSRLLDGGFVATLSEISTDELRERRDEAVDVETRVSYARRILQGRIDLLRSEISRRDNDDAEILLQSLPHVLSDGSAPAFNPAQVRLPRTLAPPDAGAVDVDLEDAVSLGDLTDEQIANLATRYADHEQHLSTVRRRLFSVIDAFQEELGERYRTGAASVAELLSKDV